MFEKLDQVNWTELTHAYGPAADVPGQIRGLASPVADTRNKALSGLHGNIWHQGSVYKATAYAVPFLIEILEEPGIPGKDEILMLLSRLANGHSYHDVHQHLSF